MFNGRQQLEKFHPNLETRQVQDTWKIFSVIVLISCRETCGTVAVRALRNGLSVMYFSFLFFVAEATQMRILVTANFFRMNYCSILPFVTLENGSE